MMPHSTTTERAKVEREQIMYVYTTHPEPQPRRSPPTSNWPKQKKMQTKPRRRS